MLAIFLFSLAKIIFPAIASNKQMNTDRCWSYITLSAYRNNLAGDIWQCPVDHSQEDLPGSYCGISEEEPRVKGIKHIASSGCANVWLQCVTERQIKEDK